LLEVSMGYLDETQEAIAKVAEKTGRSVVGVGQRWGIGSGVVVAEGRILTNAHNVRGDEVTVTFDDGRTAEGKVAGIDVDGDLAVIDVDTGGSPKLEWESNGTPGIGKAVFALSNPGGRGLRVTLGFVSGIDRSFRGPRGRRIRGSIEHDAPLLPGSSGGPIVDTDGRLLGINTNRLGEGFYLAIAADESLRTKIDSLAKGESTERPRLGIGIAPAHVARRLRRAVGLPEADGLLIREVEDDSPAAKAGLERGDLILEVAGKTVEGVDDLFEAMEAAGKDSVEMKLLRGVDERTVTVTLRKS
jgi:S1-C subfamily serine protease